MKRILVADSETAMRRALGLNLTANAYRVVSASTGARAIQATATERPDLLLLDLQMQGMTGLQVLAAVRGWADIPILTLTAQDDQRDRVAALDAGADDCMAKPFHMAELLARVRVLLRRDNHAGFDLLKVTTSWIQLDFVGRHAQVGAPHQREVHLTATEWQIVEYLVRNEGRLISHRMLTSAVWGDTYSPSPNLLRVHMRNIRRKLEAVPGEPRQFITVNGLGYRFENDLAVAAKPPARSSAFDHREPIVDDRLIRPVRLPGRPIVRGNCLRHRSKGLR